MTIPLDLDELERLATALRDAAGADQIHYALEAFESAANPATILALISQAREAERMRGELAELRKDDDRPRR